MSSLSATIATVLSALFATSAVAQSVIFNGETFDLVERGAVDPENVWKFTEQKPRLLFVCWENPESNFTEEMAIVQRAVTATWQSNSTLKFIGWGKCAENSPGIRILIKDDANEGPGVGVNFGKKLDHLKNGMILNLTFNNWMPDCQEGPKNTWIARTAVHEFGHALAFRHEQDRNDTVGIECKLLKTGPNPKQILTKYDPKSIMNYCWCEPNSNLSDFDKLALQTLYGRPQT